MRSPEQLLRSSEITARLLPRARALIRLNQTLRDTLPDSLTHQAWVANIRCQTVIIYANNAAVATKLRQFNERLLDIFTSISGEYKQIEIKVQPVNAPSPQLRIFPEGKPAMSLASAEKLLAFARAMPEDSPLATTLRSLAERHLAGGKATGENSLESDSS
ncbi:MAG: DciA family protein [Betaproteobacteria bacterium]|nr:DciA family protein [Betaproteobacteria bacterium]